MYTLYYTSVTCTCVQGLKAVVGRLRSATWYLGCSSWIGVLYVVVLAVYVAASPNEASLILFIVKENLVIGVYIIICRLVYIQSAAGWPNCPGSTQ